MPPARGTIPPIQMEHKKPSAVPLPANPELLTDHFQAFVELVKVLRRECPWDRSQTHESISHLFIEEAYEMTDAIGSGNDQEFAKELGDLLLHIVMHAVMAEERGAFSMRNVLERIHTKLVHRHPHVFGDAAAQVGDDPDAVIKRWEELKMKEGRSSALEGVPRHLPALLRAQRMQEKAANIGFDWDNRQDVWKKVEEEIQELKHEILSGNKQKAGQELGDVLFSLVNAARFEQIIAEDALHGTNNKFQRRFAAIEQKAAEQGRSLRQMTLAEMDILWDEVKKQEKL
jgi:MazG family protein